jgi:hypothetical protein
VRVEVSQIAVAEKTESGEVMTGNHDGPFFSHAVIGREFADGWGRYHPRGTTKAQVIAEANTADLTLYVQTAVLVELQNIAAKIAAAGDKTAAPLDTAAETVPCPVSAGLARWVDDSRGVRRVPTWEEWRKDPGYVSWMRLRSTCRRAVGDLAGRVVADITAEDVRETYGVGSKTAGEVLEFLHRWAGMVE